MMNSSTNKTIDDYEDVGLGTRRLSQESALRSRL